MYESYVCSSSIWQTKPRLASGSHACLLHCRRLRWLPHLNHRAAQLYSICQSTQKLMASSEKGSDEVKIDMLHRIIIAAGNGNPQVRFVVIVLWWNTDRRNAISHLCYQSYNMCCRHKKKKAAEETLTFLLESVSEVWRQWQTWTGDNIGGVRI